MKKILVVLAAVVLVLSFAGAALAIHAEIPAETQAIVAKGSTQITLGGEIRIRGWYYHNLGHPFSAAVPGTPEVSNSKANWDQRVRLNIDAQVTPNVQAYIQLESSNDVAGQSDTWTWGNLNRKPATMNIAQAWILYTGSGLFGFNAGVKAGHMPLKLGEGIFFDNTQFGDDALVFFMDPTKQLHIGLLTIKASEGTTGDNTNDLDAYVALMTYKVAPTHTVGMNYTYINNSDAELKFQNLAVHANGTAGKFGYKAEVDFQFGSVNIGDKVKFGGFAAFLAANYKVTPALNLRGSFGYGSGIDENDTKIKEFQTLVGTIPHYTFVYDYRARTAAQFQVLNTAGTGSTGSGIANTTYYNIGLDFAATKDLSFKTDFFLLRASKNLNTGASKNIGWELDANMTYKVAKNLTYQINAGYLKAGRFYESSVAVHAVGDDRRSATVLNNVLTLSF